MKLINYNNSNQVRNQVWNQVETQVWKQVCNQVSEVE